MSKKSGGLLMRLLWSRWSRPPGVIPVPGRTDEERAYYALNDGVYAKLARAYDAAVRPLRKLRRDVVELSRAGSRDRVLDVATGTGEQARAFAAKCGEVVGIDLSEEMLSIARAKKPLPNLSYVRGDATDLPFDDASFDVTTISFAVHEMPESVRDAVLEEMVRVTKPEGTVAVVDYGLPRLPLGKHIIYRIVRFYEDAHYDDFIRLDLRGLLERKGVSVLDDRPVLAGAARVVVGTRSAASGRVWAPSASSQP